MFEKLLLKYDPGNNFYYDLHFCREFLTRECCHQCEYCKHTWWGVWDISMYAPFKPKSVETILLNRGKLFPVLIIINSRSMDWLENIYALLFLSSQRYFLNGSSLGMINLIDMGKGLEGVCIHSIVLNIIPLYAKALNINVLESTVFN